MCVCVCVCVTPFCVLYIQDVLLVSTVWLCVCLCLCYLLCNTDKDTRAVRVCVCVCVCLCVYKDTVYEFVFLCALRLPRSLSSIYPNANPVKLSSDRIGLNTTVLSCCPGPRHAIQCSTTAGYLYTWYLLIHCFFQWWSGAAFGRPESEVDRQIR